MPNLPPTAVAASRRRDGTAGDGYLNILSIDIEIT
jgi:hypothetical protein